MSRLDENGNFTDIVGELRRVAQLNGELYSRRLMLDQAAGEITRLRSELSNARNAALEEAVTIVDGVRSVLDQSDGEISHARPFFKDCLRDISEAIRRKAEGESR